MRSTSTFLNSKSSLPSLVTAAAAVAVLAYPGILLAQEPANEEQEAAIEEVIVTGSRIINQSLISLSPVVQIDAEELGFQGTVRVEDMLRTLPQVYSNQSTGLSNGSTGTATLALRNLADERTLVLINGRRLPVGSPLGGGAGVDINQIPGALIKNIEILTGGASAVYGSDAVAGVINFNLDDNFEGIKLDYQTSFYEHKNRNAAINQLLRDQGFAEPGSRVRDGNVHNLSLLIGGNFDDGRGNATAYATYWKIDPVIQGDRIYSACSLNNNPADGCSGSSTIPQGRITDFGTSGGFDFVVAGTGDDRMFINRTGELYNFGALNYYQRPDERVTLGVLAHYDLKEDQIEAYMELMYADDRSVSQIAPSGAFFVTDTIPCGNPLLSDQQFAALCGDFGLDKTQVQDAFVGRRNVEGGPRQQDFRHTTYRGVFGVRGEITQDWHFDVSYQRSEVSMENTYLNDLSTTRIIRALNAVSRPVVGGAVGETETVCQSVVDGSDPTCIPWNVFDANGVTQEQIDYLVLPLFARGTTELQVISAVISGDLSSWFKFPTADQGVSIAVGIEERDEGLSFSPDLGYSGGDGAGQGGATPAVSGGYNVTDIFFEAGIPFVTGRPYAEEVALDFAFRNSDYSTGVKTNTFGLRFGWAFSENLRMRVGYQRAIRNANVRELFAPQGFNLFDIARDPCGGAVGANGMTRGGRTFEECARSGVTMDQFGSIADSPAGQYNFLQGGSPDLEPEEGTSLTFGVVFTPSAAPSLLVTLDYFNIKINEGIDNLTPGFVLNQCLDGNLLQCESVNRNEERGDLWIGSNVVTSGHIVALNGNLSTEEISGFDLVAEYTLGLGNAGSLELNSVSSLFTKWDIQELAGAPVLDCNGQWGGDCGIPASKFQTSFRATWRIPGDVSLSLLFRHYGKISAYEENVPDLAATNYVDLTVAYTPVEGITLRTGATNLFDNPPPIAGGSAGPSINGNGNTFPSLYDAVGRYVFFGVSLSL